MDIQKMHQYFRVFAQQMGMQLVRAILPEEIDVYLNSAIVEKIREVVYSNSITVFQDKLSVQDNKISPINYIRTLYKQKEISLTNNQIVFSDGADIMFYTSMSVVYKDNNNKVFGCRFVEPDLIEETLRDYCNGASSDYPICTLYNDDKGLNIKVYTGNKTADKVIIKYIKNPNVVSYKDNISCDLPEYTHNDIVQLACQKYFISVGSTTQSVNQ